MPKTIKNKRLAGTNDRPLLEDARETVASGLDGLAKCVIRVRSSLEQGETAYDPKLASHLAYLTEHTTAVLRELRQLERHDKRTVEDMTPAEVHTLVGEYIAGVDRDGRAYFRALLDELDAKDSVLG